MKQVLIFLLLSQYAAAGTAMYQYKAHSGKDFFIIQRIDCERDGWIILEGRISSFPFSMEQMSKAKVAKQFEDCGTIQMSQADDLFKITTKISPDCGVEFDTETNTLPKVKMGSFEMDVVKLIFEIDIDGVKVIPRAEHGCPTHIVEQTDPVKYVGEFEANCNLVVLDSIDVTSAVGVSTSIDKEIIKDADFKVTRNWNDFIDSEQILTDYGKLYQMEFSATYQCNGMSDQVSNHRVLVHPPAHWLDWSDWSSCYLTAANKGMNIRSRECKFKNFDKDWNDMSKCPGFADDIRPDSDCEIGGQDGDVPGIPCPSGLYYLEAVSLCVNMNCNNDNDCDLVKTSVLFPAHLLSSKAKAEMEGSDSISFVSGKYSYYPAELVVDATTMRVNFLLHTFLVSDDTCTDVWAWPNSPKASAESFEEESFPFPGYKTRSHLTISFTSVDFKLPSLTVEVFVPQKGCEYRDINPDPQSAPRIFTLQDFGVTVTPGALIQRYTNILLTVGTVEVSVEKFDVKGDLDDGKYWIYAEQKNLVPEGGPEWGHDTCPLTEKCPETHCCASREVQCKPDEFFTTATRVDPPFHDTPVCKTSKGVHLSTTDYQSCGKCQMGQCNTIIYKCADGKAIVDLRGCPVTCNQPVCSSEIPVWETWSSCDKSTCTRIRTRTGSISSIYSLDCQLPSEFTYFETSPCQSDLEVCDERDHTCNDGMDTIKRDCSTCDSTVYNTCTYQSNFEKCFDKCISPLSCKTGCCEAPNMIQSGDPYCETNDECSAGISKVYMGSTCPKVENFQKSVPTSLCSTNNKTSCKLCGKDLTGMECVESDDQICRVGQDGYGKKTVKICWSIADPTDVCEIEEHCTPRVCTDSIKTDCCTTYSISCDHTTITPHVNPCDGKSVCMNGIGETILGGIVDCCADLDSCTEEEIKLCNPCDHISNEYTCLSSTRKTRCPKQNCQVKANTCPCSPTGICQFDPKTDSVKVMTINSKLLNTMEFTLPSLLFGNSVKFFIDGVKENKGHNAKESKCYRMYNRGEETTLAFTRAELTACGVELVMDGTELKSFYAHIFVDRDIFTEGISTHYAFAGLSCTSWEVTLENDAKMMSELEVSHFKDTVDASVKADFSLSTNGFKSDDPLSNSNIVLVGQTITGKIESTDDPFQIISCSIIGEGGIDYMMLDGPCPKEGLWRDTFKFEYLTQSPKKKVFQWQSVIFREGALHQKIQYVCKIRPCAEEFCDFCDSNPGRRRRDAKEGNLTHKATNFGIMLDIFATQEDRDRAFGVKELQLTKDISMTVIASIMFLASVVGTLVYFFSDPNFGSRRAFHQVNPLTSLQKVFLRRVTQPTPLETNENNCIKNVDLVLQGDPDFIRKSLTRTSEANH